MCTGVARASSSQFLSVEIGTAQIVAALWALQFAAMIHKLRRAVRTEAGGIGSDAKFCFLRNVATVIVGRADRVHHCRFYSRLQIKREPSQALFRFLPVGDQNPGVNE